LGAFPPSAGTGLSACIFFAEGKKGYRCNPLREPKPLGRFWFCGVLLRKTPGTLPGVWALPQTPKTKTLCVLVPLALLKNGIHAVFEL
jgi:hypothetical protein